MRFCQKWIYVGGVVYAIIPYMKDWLLFIFVPVLFQKLSTGYLTCGITGGGEPPEGYTPKYFCLYVSLAVIFRGTLYICTLLSPGSRLKLMSESAVNRLMMLMSGIV